MPLLVSFYTHALSYKSFFYTSSSLLDRPSCTHSCASLQYDGTSSWVCPLPLNPFPLHASRLAQVVRVGPSTGLCLLRLSLSLGLLLLLLVLPALRNDETAVRACGALLQPPACGRKQAASVHAHARHHPHPMIIHSHERHAPVQTAGMHACMAAREQLQFAGRGDQAQADVAAVPCVFVRPPSVQGSTRVFSV